MISRVAIVSCGALSALASALPAAPVQASEPDTINIDFDVPSAGLREATSNLGRRFAVRGRSASALSASASFLASPEVNVHVPVPAVSSRKASAWLHDARAKVAALKSLLRRQDAADESVKIAAATAGVSLLETHSGALAPGDDLAKAVLAVAESSAGGAVASALAPSNPLAGKVSDAAAAIQSSRVQPDLFACDADFAAACPDGWSQSGGACVAPAAYSGPCERRREFASGDVSAKALFADSCDALWPCKGDSDGCSAGHDFAAVQRAGRKVGSAFVSQPERALAAPRSISQTWLSVRSSIWQKLAALLGHASEGSSCVSPQCECEPVLAACVQRIVASLRRHGGVCILRVTREAFA